MKKRLNNRALNEFEDIPTIDMELKISIYHYIRKYKEEFIENGIIVRCTKKNRALRHKLYNGQPRWLVRAAKFNEWAKGRSFCEPNGARVSARAPKQIVMVHTETGQRVGFDDSYEACKFLNYRSRSMLRSYLRGDLEWPIYRGKKGQKKCDKSNGLYGWTGYYVGEEEEWELVYGKSLY